jgi:3-dehydroquinate dehydratase
MSLICVPISVEAAGEVPLALERAARARVLGARMVEWRCDGLASDADAEALLKAFNIKTIGDLGTNKYFLWAQAIVALADREV